jgi:hypothetical protein
VGSLRSLRRHNHKVFLDVSDEYTRLKFEWMKLVNHYRSSPLKELKKWPVYQEIIGLGRSVVPLMLRDIEIDRDFLLRHNMDEHIINNYLLFDAIKQITGESIIPNHLVDRLDCVIGVYLEWGRVKGYL